MRKLADSIFEIESTDIKEKFRIRASDTNKGDYGYVGIMGGCLLYTGSVKLASMSAETIQKMANASEASMRSGCGVVRVIVNEEVAYAVAPYLLEQTIFTLKDYKESTIDEALHKLKALAIGMGWGKDSRHEKILKYILDKYNIPIVIDADGLNTLANMGKAEMQEVLNRSKCKVILTPHLKEFERLSGITIENIKKDEISIAKDFAKKCNVILLLKGPNTILTDGEVTYLVKRGCPGMATAGSGDVLSGILVGLLGYNIADLLTVSAGAFLNGVAGEIAQEKYTDISMLARDTVECIQTAIKKNFRNEWLRINCEFCWEKKFFMI